MTIHTDMLVPPKTGIRDESGFTLLEVIVSTAILGLAVAGLIGALATGLRISETVEKQTVSATLATCHVEATPVSIYSPPPLPTPRFLPECFLTPNPVNRNDYFNYFKGYSVPLDDPEKGKTKVYYGDEDKSLFEVCHDHNVPCTTSTPTQPTP